ncbi:MAG: arginase family protein, partial [Rhodospirillaceae bacterium]
MRQRPMIEPEKTFCDLPFRRLDALAGSEVAIFSSCHGSPYKPGRPSHAANAPAAIRAALSWYSSNPEQLDLDTMKPVFGGEGVFDCGDVGGSLSDGEANRAAIGATTRAILDSGAVPIVIGGDDSVPIPFIEAISERVPVTVVQIDAHIDWRDEVDGERYGFSSTMRRASEFAGVTGIVQIGGRGPGSARQADLDAARAWGVDFFFARDVHKHGLGPVIDVVPEGANVILAVDVDGLDPSVVPGVVLPAFGGLSYAQVTEIILSVMAKANIVGADFVEMVPERD